MRAAARSIKIEYYFFDKLKAPYFMGRLRLSKNYRFPSSLSLETTLSSEY